MPYENLMPYMPLAQPQSLASLLERARLNREQYEEQALENVRRTGGGLAEEMREMSKQHAARGSALANPSWDAWFQAVNEATGGRGGSGIVSGGRAAGQQQRAMELEAADTETEMAELSPYNVEGRARIQGARPSLRALSGLSYLRS